MAISPRARLDSAALGDARNNFSGSFSQSMPSAAAALSPSASQHRQRSGSPPGTAGGGGARFDAKQHTIDVLTQELNGARAAAKRASQEVALLRHQIGVLRGQGVRLRTDRPATEEMWIVFCRSVLAMGKCPDSTVLKSLHSCVGGTSSSSVIDVEVPPSCDYVQLSALAEATRVARPDVHRFAVDLHEASHVPFIVQTLDGFSSLRELCASRVTDASLPAVVHALTAHPELEVVELPQLSIGDDSAGLLHKALHERSVLADAGAAVQLAPMELDFSQCYFKSASTFAVYGGRLESLVVKGQQFFTYDEVRRSVESCGPGGGLLQHLCLHGTMVDNRVCSLLDSCPSVKELNLVACNHITHVVLKHVTHLHTDGRRVVEFSCPSVVELCSPLTHFAPAIVRLPKVEEMSFLNATLTKREMELLGAACQTVLDLKFLGCKLEGLGTALRQLRKVKTLSLHSCKGVRDCDLTVLFEPLEELDLTDNFCLTDEVIDAVARCPRLVRLSLKRCANITDLGIQKLEAHPSLEFVNCLGLKKVSGAAVQRLIRSSMQQPAPPVAPPSLVATEQAAEEQAAAATAEMVEDGSTTVVSSAAEQEVLAPPEPRQPLEVRHSTAISTDAMIERDDDEEAEREAITKEQRKLEDRKAALSCFKRQLVRAGDTGLAMSSDVSAAASPSRLLQSRGARSLSSSLGGRPSTTAALGAGSSTRAQSPPKAAVRGGDEAQQQPPASRGGMKQDL